MRMSLPIFWCVFDETRGQLASLITGLSAIKHLEWVEWPSGEPIQEFTIEELFREMKKPPKHPVKVA